MFETILNEKKGDLLKSVVEFSKTGEKINPKTVRGYDASSK